MTRPEALRRVFEQFELGARAVCVDRDPAGSNYEYHPDPGDVDVVQTLLGRTVAETELCVVVGAGPFPTRFHMRTALIDELTDAASSNAATA